MANRYRVAVVGYGIGGAATAALLARSGHEVTLFERASVVGPVGAGILLQPSGQEVLRRLGILESVTTRAAPIDEIHAMHTAGKGTLLRSRYDDYVPGMRAYGVHRGVLFDALKALVDGLPVRVELNAEIESRRVEGNAVSLTDRRGQVFGPFDFTVCADGSQSHLRSWVPGRPFVHRYDYGTWWAIVPAAVNAPRLLQVVQGCRRLCGVLPVGEGLCTLYWGMRKKDVASVRERGIAALKQEIGDFCPEAAPLLAAVTSLDQLLFTSYQHVWMFRRSDPHAIFLGDAAHAMSPHLGQGINLALLDAFWLDECLRSAPDYRSAFTTHRRLQSGYLRYMSLLTLALSPFFQSDCPLLGWGRDRFLPLFPKIPWVKRQMLMTVAGMKGGFFRGPIRLP